MALYGAAVMENLCILNNPFFKNVLDAHPARKNREITSQSLLILLCI